MSNRQKPLDHADYCEVVLLLANGKKLKEIAHEFGRAESTVKGNLWHLRCKVKAKNNVHLVAIYLRAGHIK